MWIPKAPSLTFDLACFLFFIVNDNPRLRTLPVDRGAGVRVLEGGKVIDLEEQYTP